MLWFCLQRLRFLGQEVNLIRLLHVRTLFADIVQFVLEPHLGHVRQLFVILGQPIVRAVLLHAQLEQQTVQQIHHIAHTHLPATHITQTTLEDLTEPFATFLLKHRQR
uniref:Putative secreted peptide n=1 Tax=Anopheles braziliensis TaxID=58242 RepID=A0A2M3ZTL6_9DIPT